MPEKDVLYSSKVKHAGIFSFASLYKFCYDWLVEETGLFMQETKYVEKIKGDTKEVEVEWEGFKKLTDYFKFETKVKFKVLGLKEVEIVQDGTKKKTNQGQVEISIKSVLVRDWQGSYDKTSFQKFLRETYDKWVIPSRIDQFEGKVIGDSDEFLGQVKSWLALEGRERH